jgi:hypothetical protein
MADYVNPTREQFGAFAGMAGDGPVQMLNLVRFRERAAYEDGRTATGAEAYRAYAKESEPIFTRLGGRQVWIGRYDLNSARRQAGLARQVSIRSQVNRRSDPRTRA